MSYTIFVFGSNLAGRHGKGAAKYARDVYGAENGVGEGMTGSAYALPTKDERLRPLSLRQIRVYLERFARFAEDDSDHLYLLTPVGCGLAGHAKRDVWKLLAEVGIPDNVVLTSSWVTEA